MKSTTSGRCEARLGMPKMTKSWKKRHNDDSSEIEGYTFMSAVVM